LSSPIPTFFFLLSLVFQSGKTVKAKNMISPAKIQKERKEKENYLDDDEDDDSYE
jgi:hypothetical protein